MSGRVATILREARGRNSEEVECIRRDAVGEGGGEGKTARRGVMEKKGMGREPEKASEVSESGRSVGRAVWGAGGGGRGSE